MSDLAGQWFEVGDHQLDFPGIYQFTEMPDAFCRMAHGGQISGHRFSVAHLIIYIGEAESVNFCDLKIIAKIFKPAIEGSYVNGMSLIL